MSSGKRYVFLITVSVMLVSLVLLGSCVPEVVKNNAEGNAQFEQGAYAEALDAYRLAQVSEPDQPEPYYNAANTYNRQGDVSGTALQTEQALKSADANLQAQAWYNLGNAHFDTRQWSQAVDAYKAALRLNPEDGDAKHNLELALRSKQEEQKQEDSNQEEQQQQENQEQGEQDTSEQDAANEETEQKQTSQSPESGETEEQQSAEQTQEMTPDQAQQLLEALLSDSETLQEHLQQYFQSPGNAPEEDW